MMMIFYLFHLIIVKKFLLFESFLIYCLFQQKSENTFVIELILRLEMPYNKFDNCNANVGAF